jgi:hypothetical protein
MLISLDRRDEAKQLAQSLVCKAGAQSVLMSVIEVLAMYGQTATADRIASDYNLFYANSPVSKFRPALLSLALQNSEKAMSLLSAACEERETEFVWLAHDRRFDILREDRRFGLLLAEVMHASSTLETEASPAEPKIWLFPNQHYEWSQRVPLVLRGTVIEQAENHTHREFASLFIEQITETEQRVRLI